MTLAWPEPNRRPLLLAIAGFAAVVAVAVPLARHLTRPVTAPKAS